DDLFTTVKNLSILVDALESSRDLLRNLNQNFAATTSLLSNQPNELGHATADINAVVGDVQSFVAENRESLGTTSDKLASVSTALDESLDDIKQVLHTSTPAFANFLNIYQPSQGALTGILSTNFLSNPLQFICGAVQAASKLGAEEASKLCVQYLAPIVKNRQYNSLPLGENLFIGQSARPNELTYSEDWLRPDYIPPSGTPAPDGATSQLPPAGAPFTNFGESADPNDGHAPFVPAVPDPGPPAPPPVRADPNAGLAGLMVPTGAGS
ncbi:MAG: mammalian cell entry protein, partial [Mycobacterium sp.]